MRKKPGPEKKFPERTLSTFPEGTKARVLSVLDDGESERKFIRDAVVAQVEKRERERNKSKRTR